MRALGVAALLALFSSAVRADNGQFPSKTMIPPIPDRESNIEFHYEAESLAGWFTFGLGGGRVEFGIGNAFVLPEYEPPGGFHLDEHTLLSEELNGIEVDTAGERLFWLTFSVEW